MNPTKNPRSAQQTTMLKPRKEPRLGNVYQKRVKVHELYILYILIYTLINVNFTKWVPI